MEKDLELIKAFELSLIKWEYLVNNSGNYNYDKMLKANPEIENLVSHCGLCEYNSKYKKDDCNACPIAIKRSDGFRYDENARTRIGYIFCSHKQHPFCIWRTDKTKENAQKVLDLIKKAYKDYLDFTEMETIDESTEDI